MRKKILGLAAVTLIGFPLLGWPVMYFFSDKSYGWMFRQFTPLWQQLSIGLVVGVIAGILAWYISESKWVSPRSGKYLSMIGEMNLGSLDIIIISICAGVGEELFFRGAIQPLLGVWLTAFIFVLIHGYINPKDWRISIYGLSLTLIIALLGYMCDRYGIWSAAMAHTMIDYVLLRLMNKKWKERKKMLIG